MCIRDRKDTSHGNQGEIKIELIDNTNILYGNPFVWEAQSQPYILLVKRVPLDDVVREARAHGVTDTSSITPVSYTHLDVYKRQLYRWRNYIHSLSVWG